MRFFDDLTDASKTLYGELKGCPNCLSPPDQLRYKETSKSNPKIICKKCGLVISVRNRTNNIKDLLVMVAIYSFVIGYALGVLL